MTAGIHHVTAICGDAQRNVDFYAGVLGLRLVKRTVNFDDPQTYHLYYGDEVGAPGSLITFFPWPGAPRGRVGPGQVAATSFAIAPSALGFWIERLLRSGVAYRGPTARRVGDIAEQVLAFRDPDDLQLEIVATPLAERRIGWDGAPGITAAFAIRGIHGVTLWEQDGADTARVLVELLGLESIGTDGTINRLGVVGQGPASIADVRTTGDFPRCTVLVGTVHHVAWRVVDEREQLALRERLIAGGLDPTPVIDRQYFRSVYFREPGGVLFELATDGPGFTIDE
ncbi:MAG TPA: VOC family protein, partial [Gemmatimonadaceae bacterium]|nr:VOC family protein [Gemmatimonadaceae bacterium]